MLRQRKRSTECNALSRLKIDKLVETEKFQRIHVLNISIMRECGMQYGIQLEI
jgi:hypothetical protein